MGMLYGFDFVTDDGFETAVLRHKHLGPEYVWIPRHLALVIPSALGNTVTLRCVGVRVLSKAAAAQHVFLLREEL